MPNDGIGVIVLVIGDHVAPFYNGLTYHIYERLLGLPLTPWSERLNEIRLKNKAAGTKARAVAAVGQVAATKPSHPWTTTRRVRASAYGVVTVARGDKDWPSSSTASRCRSATSTTTASTRPTTKRTGSSR